MKIINVVEIINGVLYSIESFPILNKTVDNNFFDEQEAIIKAEELFCKMAHENGMPMRDASHHLENGNYDNYNGYEVLIHWSAINIKE